MGVSDLVERLPLFATSQKRNLCSRHGTYVCLRSSVARLLFMELCWLNLALTSLSMFSIS